MNLSKYGYYRNGFNVRVYYFDGHVVTKILNSILLTHINLRTYKPKFAILYHVQISVQIFLLKDYP